MSNQVPKARRNLEESRSVFLSFEFQKDASRRGAFIGQARKLCKLSLVDKSLPAAEHSNKWRQDVRKRMRESDVVIVLLGPDTQNAPGVKDELSLAGEVGCPVVQLMPQGKNYGLVARNQATCEYKWPCINQMLGDPVAFAKSSENRESDDATISPESAVWVPQSGMVVQAHAHQGHQCRLEWVSKGTLELHAVEVCVPSPGSSNKLGSRFRRVPGAINHRINCIADNADKQRHD